MSLPVSPRSQPAACRISGRARRLSTAALQLLLVIRKRSFLEAPPTQAPQHIASQIKGYTSHELREKFPDLKSRLPSLWSRRYYVGSAGAVSSANNQSTSQLVATAPWRRRMLRSRT